jgi:hypothetical protein
MTKHQPFCPWCRHSSGNTVVVDFPNPPTKQVISLICEECAKEFDLVVEHSGMTTHGKATFDAVRMLAEIFVR